MRLTHLRLKNFMSHASTDLDLSGVRAAVGSGPTGGGKSALFVEAPLWALFGRVRSKRADGWMKIGTDETQVEVGFDSNGTSYRVIRSRSLKTKSGKSDLQLACRNGAGWVPLSGKSIAETQVKIEAILGVSYDTITSANISRQGEADKFTNPGILSIDGHQYTGAQARIQVLAQMLGLGVYADWRQTASGAARDVEAKAGILEAQVAEIDRTLATRPARESALVQAETVVAHSRDQQATASAQIEQASRELARIEGEIPRATQDLAAFADDRQALWSRQKTQADKANRAERYHDLLARRAVIEADAARATALDAELAEQGKSLAGLEAEGRGVASQVTRASAGVTECLRAVTTTEARLSEARRRVSNRPELERKVSRLTAARTERHRADQEHEAIEAEILTYRAALDVVMRANQGAQKARGEILAEEKRIAAEKAGLVPQIAGHQARTAVMDVVPCIGVDGLPERCPLLKDARDSVPVLARLHVQHQDLCGWVRPALPEIAATAEEEKALRRLATDNLAVYQTMRALDQEITVLRPAEAELASLATVEAMIPGLQADKEAGETSHREVVTQLNGLKDRLEVIRGTYTSLKATITQNTGLRATLQASVDLLPDLTHAERELPGLTVDIETLDAEITGLTATLAKESDLQASLERMESDLARIRAAVQLDRTTLASLRSDEQAGIERAASARADLQRLTALSAEQAEATAEAAALRSRHSTLLTLAEAYRQIPLMILETMAIPCLEEEANRLLSRISAHGMWIKLATQRAVKSRDTLADALDIVVTDTVGERNYEEFSGGEGWEIDLALRIALAKLQARKAGATIQTLILDEGMGTQSGDRLEALVAALREIQNDFPLLLVITHVEALKDCFASRVDVSGGPRNSVAELVMV
jgi:exonuclease SbcC